MQNVAGLLIVATGVLFCVIGLRGTQHAVFPNLFPTANTTNGSNAPAAKSGGSAGAF